MRRKSKHAFKIEHGAFLIAHQQFLTGEIWEIENEIAVLVEAFSQSGGCESMVISMLVPTDVSRYEVTTVGSPLHSGGCRGILIFQVEIIYIIFRVFTALAEYAFLVPCAFSIDLHLLCRFPCQAFSYLPVGKFICCLALGVSDRRCRTGCIFRRSVLPTVVVLQLEISV